MSKALYRKYRSKSLDQIVGQSHITDILAKSIDSGRISHAYLLTGPRGVGKTSVARILAHQINQLPYDEDSTHLDIIEIDAASNNGVDDVRDLREKVQLAPVSAAKKVYIIDEVHMLSKPAFNALLKTLEEPPSHVVFILATTDVEKLPATIVSRTQRFGFRPISKQDAVSHLKHIAKEEKIKISDSALELISEHGDGSFRDSISLLDQLTSLADSKEGITEELVQHSLGLASSKLVEDLIQAVDSGDISKIAGLIDASVNDGTSPLVLSKQLTSALLQMIATSPKYIQLFDSLLDVSKSSHPQLKLLSVLSSYAVNNRPSKNAALSAPVLEVSASVEQLIKKEPAKTKTKTNDQVKDVAKKARKSDGPKIPFDWHSLIDYTKQNHVALYSVLSKCGYELTDNELTIYTGNAFYNKKLEDPKYSQHLHQSLESIGSYQLAVHILPTAPPLKDSQAASIAVIMGGGEEVNIDA